METKKRTRPRSGRASALPPLNAPYPGCCTPYPDATFENQTLVKLESHHRGKNCRGFVEPISMEVWNEDVDRRNANRGRSRGDDR